MHILIAEDDSACSRIICDLFEPYGTTTAVGDGESVIRTVTAALVRQQPFDLICLDIHMPNLDGLACLRCIRSIEHGFGRTFSSGSKILMITGEDQSDVIISAFRNQCEGYLVKPFMSAQLHAQLVKMQLSSG